MSPIHCLRYSRDSRPTRCRRLGRKEFRHVSSTDRQEAFNYATCSGDDVMATHFSRRAHMLLSPQLRIKNAKLNVTSSTPHQPTQLAFSLRRLLVRGFNVAWATFFQRRKIFTFFFRSTGGKSAIIIKLNYPASAFEGAQSASFLWESDEILISAVESGNICNLVFTAPSS